jgi:hypothetical protein
MGRQQGTARRQLTLFIIRLHDLGMYFRSLHIGNVVITPDGRIGLIDFADLRIYPWSLGVPAQRNMQRMLGMADEADWVTCRPSSPAGRRGAG